jgi:glycosyltransferase involved in cell wall biosynthesis
LTRLFVPDQVEHPTELPRLRIALILWSGQIGGGETFSVDLARAMQRLGAAPVVVFVLDGMPLSDRLDLFDIPHTELGLRRGRAVLRARHRLAQAVLEGAPDVAIVPGSGYLAAALRSGGYRAPIIGTEHGSLLQLKTLSPLRRLVRKADFRSGTSACSVVVTVSEYMRERFAALLPRRRVVCIPNGVDLERFSPSQNGSSSMRAAGEMVIGCAARLVEGKGIEDAIRTLLDPSLRRATLRIAGTGPLQETLQELASSVGVERRVDFLGPVLDMPRFWQSIDVAMVPSRSGESFGMVAIEAMACGKPVVASDSGALSSIVVHGKTGRVVPAGDTAALARAAAEYADDWSLRARHGSGGRRRCEQEFGMERTAARYLDLCAAVVREAAHIGGA